MVDTENYFLQNQRRLDDRLFLDAVHPNTEGYELLARAFLEKLFEVPAVKDFWSTDSENSNKKALNQGKDIQIHLTEEQQRLALVAALDWHLTEAKLTNFRVFRQNKIKKLWRQLQGIAHQDEMSWFYAATVAIALGDAELLNTIQNKTRLILNAIRKDPENTSVLLGHMNNDNEYIKNLRYFYAKKLLSEELFRALSR